MLSPCLSTSAPPRVTFKRPLVTTTSSTTTFPPPNLSLKKPQGMNSSLYEILRIPVGATNEEIKSAYRRLARTYHPDVVAKDRRDSSADEFMRLHAAYSTLSDPGKRAVYDSQLFIMKKRPLTTVGFSGYSGRKWETDQCW
ncbi:hypothetical protein OIU77_019183 [Salix suchowensis]|uniref:J domain-containing protein n=1 Tax=Salix suchowensis TaxID=1278906 RepID=A0ABQ9CF77_9ROSI|nr:hypothetical protein OIU77_019183 [Salix suchowensis]